jgi:hypothetical protein
MLSSEKNTSNYNTLSSEEHNSNRTLVTTLHRQLRKSSVAPVPSQFTI